MCSGIQSMLIPHRSPDSFSSLTVLQVTHQVGRVRWELVCLWVFFSLSVLPAGTKLQQECLEMKDGRDETKIWTRCPGAGQGKEPQFFPSPVLSKLIHSCTRAFPNGSFSLLPSKSSLPCPAAGWFVLQVMVPALASLIHLSHLHRHASRVETHHSHKSCLFPAENAFPLKIVILTFWHCPFVQEIPLSCPGHLLQLGRGGLGLG